MSREATFAREAEIKRLMRAAFAFASNFGSTMMSAAIAGDTATTSG